MAPISGLDRLKHAETTSEEEGCESENVSDGNRELEGMGIGPDGPGMAAESNGVPDEPHPDPTQFKLEGADYEPAPSSEAGKTPVAPLTQQGVLSEFGYRFFIDTGLDPFDLDLRQPEVLRERLSQMRQPEQETDPFEGFLTARASQETYFDWSPEADRYDAIEDEVPAYETG